jgi:hypothetical protein
MQSGRWVTNYVSVNITAPKPPASIAKFQQGRDTHVSGASVRSRVYTGLSQRSTEKK